MPAPALTNRIEPGDPLDASEVVANIDDIAAAFNDMADANLERGAVRARHMKVAADPQPRELSQTTATPGVVYTETWPAWQTVASITFTTDEASEPIYIRGEVEMLGSAAGAAQDADEIAIFIDGSIASPPMVNCPSIPGGILERTIAAVAWATSNLTAASHTFDVRVRNSNLALGAAGQALTTYVQGRIGRVKVLR